MLGQPDRDLPARREEALARLAVTTEALRGLEKALAADPRLPAGTAQALLAGARALCPVAANTGTELAVSAGPDHAWTVHVGGDATGPQFRLSRRPPGDPAPPDGPADPAPPPTVAGQLADLLRTGTGAP